MSHLVYARKYRPQDFRSIVGQEHITRALVNAIIRNRVPHALLFTGPRGVGKTTSARVLAKALNCTGRPLPENQGLTSAELIERVEPCGECPNCKEITKGSNLAVVEIDGASNNSVDNVRQLIETLLTAPPPNIKYKIYIIDEVHMLSVAAFNALLKTLEEPPPNTIFILATTEPHKIPDTVLSRCQQHDFRRFSLNSLREQLRHIATLEGLKIENEVLELIAKRCQGGMRDASSLLERVVSFCDEEITLEEASKILGVFGFAHFAKLIENIVSGDRNQSFSLIAEAFSTSLDVKGYFSDFVSAFRIVALYSMASSSNKLQLEAFKKIEELSEEQIGILESLGGLSKTDVFFQMYDLSREVADVALKSHYPRYALEAGVVKLSTLRSLIPIAELVDKLSSVTIARESSGYAEGSAKNIQKSISRSEGVSGTQVSSEIKKKSEIISEATRVKLDPVVSPDVNLSGNSTQVDRDPALDVESENEFASREFEFIWADFLGFLKKGGHLRLETYLRRVAPKQIVCGEQSSQGLLQILGPKFVCDTLHDPEILAELKSQLFNFSRISNWKVTFEVHEDGAAISRAETSSRRPNRVVSHVPGSAEGTSQEKRAIKIKGIEEKAKQDELVKQALSVFSGSVIEKITPTSKS